MFKQQVIKNSTASGVVTYLPLTTWRNPITNEVTERGGTYAVPTALNEDKFDILTVAKAPTKWGRTNGNFSVGGSVTVLVGTFTETVGTSTKESVQDALNRQLRLAGVNGTINCFFSEGTTKCETIVSVQSEIPITVGSASVVYS